MTPADPNLKSSPTMTADRYRRVRDVFLAACEKAAPDRANLLDSLCGSDTVLRGEVDSLLREHDEAEVRAAAAAAAAAPPANGQGDHGDPNQTKIVRRGLAPVSRDDDPLDSAPPAPSPRRSSPGGGHVRAARFTPGTMVAGRYRIVGLLGRGGMGEIWEAEDLTLDGTIALKFLPRLFGRDPVWLDRVLNEVRLARQVTHPNVCRVFDISTLGGEPFISMEYVDGEDLASLLRRIGRLPRDKAVEVARQTCAGLAAAHDQGVLHRDLKPANVMIDGRGQVRLTDFGLAGQANPIDPNRSGTSSGFTAGTPAYMAPEQFAGVEGTVQTDIYALGLVLYELFTGRPAFEAASAARYAKLHQTEAPRPPSQVIDDIDPIVERVILRCLEKDPARRPQTVRAVAGALPGGDPLAAALAAGETPTPAMVAAAGGDACAPVARLGAALVATLVGLVLVVLLAARGTILSRMVDGKPLPVLADKAREVITAAGYSDTAVSAAQGMDTDSNYVHYLTEHDKSPSLWEKLAAVRPAARFFWYRQSPEAMVAREEFGMVTLNQPSRTLPGMVTVRLDALGRLLEFEAVPGRAPRDEQAAAAVAGSSMISIVRPATSPVVNAAAATGAAFDRLFAAAGLDRAAFRPVPPSRVPAVFADQRFAWQGVYPDRPDAPVRVEAATLNGRPVAFALVDPWRDAPDAPTAATPRELFRANAVAQTTLAAVTLAAGFVLVWFNLRAGRGDRQGARRLSIFIFVCASMIWLCVANHVPTVVAEFGMFVHGMGWDLVPAVLVWMCYLALEPSVRRVWPETMISWSRLLSGRALDPLVASHVLVGGLVGVAMMLLTELGNVASVAAGYAPPTYDLAPLLHFIGRDAVVSSLVLCALTAVYFALLWLLVLVLLRMVVRKPWAATAIAAALFTAVFTPWEKSAVVAGAFAAVTAIVLAVVLVRYGLVAVVTAAFFSRVLGAFPLTTDVSAWFAGDSLLALGVLAALSGAACFIAVRGRLALPRPAAA